MEIPVYQIHKVMKVYTKQLNQKKILERQKGLKQPASADQVNISPKGKRKVIVEKIASDIINKIKTIGPKDDIEYEIVDQLEKDIGQKINFQNSSTSQFVFNVIDGSNAKTQNSLSLENSDFLLERLEALTKEIVDKNMES